MPLNLPLRLGGDRFQRTSSKLNIIRVLILVCCWPRLHGPVPVHPMGPPAWLLLALQQCVLWLGFE